MPPTWEDALPGSVLHWPVHQGTEPTRWVGQQSNALPLTVKLTSQFSEPTFSVGNTTPQVHAIRVDLGYYSTWCLFLYLDTSSSEATAEENVENAPSHVRRMADSSFLFAFLSCRQSAPLFISSGFYILPRRTEGCLFFC